jgi:hypothetical protein
MLYNLGKVNNVLFKISYINKYNARLVAVKGGNEFFNYLMNNYRGCNGLGVYSNDGEKFVSLSRIDAMTREEYKYFNLDSLKVIFKKWKESKMPVQDSLF